MRNIFPSEIDVKYLQLTNKSCLSISMGLLILGQYIFHSFFFENRTTGGQLWPPEILSPYHTVWWTIGVKSKLVKPQAQPSVVPHRSVRGKGKRSIISRRTAGHKNWTEHFASRTNWQANELWSLICTAATLSCPSFFFGGAGHSHSTVTDLGLRCLFRPKDDCFSIYETMHLISYAQEASLKGSWIHEHMRRGVINRPPDLFFY